jgi:hypothetical protein
MKQFGKRALLAVALSFCSPLFAQQPAPELSIKTLMTSSEFKSAGLDKLTSAELAALDNWLTKFATVAASSISAERKTQMPATSQASSYVVQASAKDKLFIISGEGYEAKTSCVDVSVGDRVKFVEGSPLGACDSATFLDLRTNRLCEVWCS